MEIFEYFLGLNEYIGNECLASKCFILLHRFSAVFELHAISVRTIPTTVSHDMAVLVENGGRIAIPHFFDCVPNLSEQQTWKYVYFLHCLYLFVVNAEVKNTTRNFDGNLLYKHLMSPITCSVEYKYLQDYFISFLLALIGLFQASTSQHLTCSSTE